MELPPLDLDETLNLTPLEGAQSLTGSTDWGLPSPEAYPSADLGPLPEGAAAADHALSGAVRQQEASLAGWNVDASSSGMMEASQEQYAEQVTVLLEERDALVDRLLSTTEALHAAEAKQREGAAAAAQVQQLLTQLQDLLRRAEAERDRAQRQLQQQALMRRAGAGTSASSGGSLPPLATLDMAGSRRASGALASVSFTPEPGMGPTCQLSLGASDSSTPTAASLAALAAAAAVAAAAGGEAQAVVAAADGADAGGGHVGGAVVGGSPKAELAGGGGGDASPLAGSKAVGSELRHRKPVAAAAAAKTAAAVVIADCSNTAGAGTPTAAAAHAAAPEAAALAVARAPCRGSRWPVLITAAAAVGIALLLAAVLLGGSGACGGRGASVAQLRGRVQELELALQQMQLERQQEAQFLAGLVGQVPDKPTTELRRQVGCATALLPAWRRPWMQGMCLMLHVVALPALHAL